MEAEIALLSLYTIYVTAAPIYVAVAPIYVGAAPIYVAAAQPYMWQQLNHICGCSTEKVYLHMAAPKLES